MELPADANAAIGIFGRQGLGKVRQLDLRYMWIQAALRRKPIALKKYNGQLHGRDGNKSARQRFDRETCEKSGMCLVRPIESGTLGRAGVRTDTTIYVCNRSWPPLDRVVDVPVVMQHTEHDFICLDMCLCTHMLLAALLATSSR